MRKRTLITLMLVTALALCASPITGFCQNLDIRGPWVGSAKGSIFGAEGSVVITHQQGERIHGMVEGGNFLGRAKFPIDGLMRGNYIFGAKDGHTFQGFLYADGTIRGMFTADDGDKFSILLRRPYPQWGMPYQGMW